MPPSLANRIAVVTGASRGIGASPGIGAAIAIGLADAWADVAVNDRARSVEAGAVVGAIRVR